MLGEGGQGPKEGRKEERDGGQGQEAGWVEEMVASSEQNHCSAESLRETAGDGGEGTWKCENIFHRQKERLLFLSGKSRARTHPPSINYAQ